jgi:hypothetical protein
MYYGTLIPDYHIRKLVEVQLQMALDVDVGTLILAVQ